MPFTATTICIATYTSLPLYLAFKMKKLKQMPLMIVLLLLYYTLQAHGSDETLNAGTSSTTIQSAAYPNNYADNANYEWTITAETGRQIFFIITDLDTEACCDYVEIKEGDILVGKYQGSATSDIPIFSTGNEITVRFFSDNSVSSKGFQATYKSAQNCGSLLEAGRGLEYFASPNFPNAYSDNLDCFWTIEAHTGKNVEIQILESDTQACCDFIDIYEDIHQVGHIGGEIVTPFTFTSVGEKVTVYFHSNENTNGKGFRASYQEATCGGSYEINDEAVYTIASPGYPLLSRDNLDCVFILQTVPGYSIALTLEVDTEACCDYVEVYDGGRSLGQIRGLSRENFFVSNAANLTLHYYTDESVVKTGFKAMYKRIASKCPTNEWTGWFDRDDPSGACDCEQLVHLRREMPGVICDVPTDFQARVKQTKAPYNPFLTNVEASPTHGLGCFNGVQRCDDYEIRFCCPKPPVPDIGTCTASGDPHYTTFDGQRYDFMGTCSYTLVQHISTNAKVPSFQIEVENKHRYGNTRVSYLEKVIVRIGKNPVITLQGSEVMVGAKTYKMESLLFEKSVSMSFSGRFIRFKSSFKLEFLYDQNSYIEVKLPKQYAENVKGLCGNFNGVQKDDLQNVTSKEPLNAVEFANQFQTDTKNNCAAAQPPMDEECQADKLVDYTARCSVMKKGNACFADCPVDSTPYIENCVFDACTFDDAEDALDQNVGAYAEKCQSEGYEICDWRNITKTPFLCPSNSHYEVCTSRCPETCASPITDILPCNETSCTEGCKCDDGFILSDQECVPTSNCGCNVDGTYYKAGETFYNDTTCTNKCSCQDRMFSCAQSPCSDGEQCDALKEICVPISFAMSSGWGDPHYMTLDGSGWYDFYGSCAYTLSETHQLNSNNSRWFSIEAQNEHRRGNTRVSYLQHITVKLSNGDLVARLKKNRVIQVNGKVVQGYNTPQLTIGPSGAATLLTTQHGVQVSFDGNAVRVILPSIYRGKVRGMLGNYNGIKADDLEMKSGKLTNDYNELARSYQVGFCSKPDVPVYVCSATDKQKWGAAGYCGMLTSTTGPFPACHEVVDARGFHSNCVLDVCATDGDRETLKQVLETYVSECQARGVQLCNWRAATGFINIQCPVNSHYVGCATPCPDTCQTPLASASCSATHTVEDCVCDPGYIRDGDRCVRKSECGTTKDGAYTSKGPAKLPPLSYCYATGDPHYTTFDGKRFDFMGTCSYVLVKNSTNKQPFFEVEVDNEFRNGITRVSWLRKVYIRIHRNTHIPKLVTIELLKGRKLKLDNKEINSKYSTKELSISLSSRLLVVKTSFGLQVEYDGNHYLRIGLSKSFAEKVEGLCGNYNANPYDDFMDRGSNNIIGDVVTFVTQYQTTTKQSCVIPSPDTTRYCPKEAEFNTKCSILTKRGGCFSDCHVSVNSLKYFEDCLFDACALNDAQDALESHVSAYAKECQDAGATICDWRDLTNTPLICQANSHYSLCGSRCPATCGSLNPSCPSVCEEGCVCDEGFVLSAEECVPLAECGCTDDNGIYYKAGATFYKDDTCTEKCTCLNGTLFCSNEACELREKCGKNKRGKTDCIPRGAATGVAWGDPHYMTFDGSGWFHFMGICKYTMVETYKLNSTDPRWFSIEAKNEHRYGKTHVSYLRYIDVKLLNGKTVVRLEKGTKFRVNGQLVQEYNKPYLNIRPSGSYVLLKTRFGLQVEFNGGRLNVKIPSTYFGLVHGLLGNYNDDRSDDLQMKSGVIATNYGEVAESFQVGTCTSKIPPLFKCSDSDRLKWGDEKYCGALTDASGPFSSCHGEIDPTALFENCIYDVCATEGDRDTLRRALEGYVSQCQRRNIELCNWRVETGFVNTNCPVNSHYEGCASPCPNTCLLPFASSDCDEDGTVEDCVCDTGFIKDGDKCIRKADCAIPVDGVYVNPECGKNLLANATYQFMSSQNYPDQYANNLDCEWTISAPDGSQILLEITDLDTEACCDYLEVFDGFESIGKFSGNVITQRSFLSRNQKLIVKFYSDDTKIDVGFKAKYKQVTDCGSQLMAEPEFKSISTPNYPGSHPNGLDCYWELFSITKNRIELIFEEGALDSCCDHIDVTEASSSIGQIKGNITTQHRFTSSETSVIVYFHSEKSSQSGFRAMFREIDCGGFYQTYGTSLNSISSPKTQAHNLDCSYDLQAERGFKIELTLDVATEECCGYVEVFDQAVSKLRIMGNATKSVFKSSGRKLGFVYHTNENRPSQGFTATYRQICSSDYIVDSTFVQLITSPNYPNDSPHNTDCEYNFKATAGSKMELVLQVVSTESCCDYIELLDGTNPLGRFNGNLPPQSFTSTGEKMTVHYHTDSSIGSRGFKLLYRLLK